jgi:N-acyl homoserine lactone hydrolase
MKIHAIRTGTVQIHTRQVVGVGNGLMRLVNMVFDKEWTAPIPITAWAIEHPEGVIVVDTGDTARTAEPNYHPRYHPFYRLAVRYAIRPEDEIGLQLIRLGIRPTDVRMVIMTHLHSDHSGGLYHFPKSEILVHPAETAAARGLGGWVAGYLPQHFPEWFCPIPIEFTNERVGAFESSQKVTRAGDVLIVPTYGHTGAHVSVLVLDGETNYLLAGDTSYSETTLLAGQVDGVSPNVGQSAATIQRILEHARLQPTVYLPTHDPESAIRLANEIVVGVKQ